jgi:transcriptional regulator GlxA family with amidase domain
MVKVAILIYEGVYLLDFCGPQEVFFDTVSDEGEKVFDVALVAPTKNPLKSHTGTCVIPDFSIDSYEKPDILVVPGGNLELGSSDLKLGKWIIETSSHCNIVLSVCTGAFILASLGLLDGLKATTWYGAAKHLQKKYPLVQVSSTNRITDNGKIITTGGVSAGIDGALHVVSKLFGLDTAKKTAQYIEYCWNPL